MMNYRQKTCPMTRNEKNTVCLLRLKREAWDLQY